MFVLRGPRADSRQAGGTNLNRIPCMPSTPMLNATILEPQGHGTPQFPNALWNHGQGQGSRVHVGAVVPSNSGPRFKSDRGTINYSNHRVL